MMNKKFDRLFFKICMTVACFTFSLCTVNDNCIAKTKVLKLEEGKTYNAKYIKGYKYSSSRPKIASVTKKGIITAHKSGKCVIILK